MKDGFQRMENFRAITQGFPEGGAPGRTMLNFLEVNGRVGVGAAVDDVHHGDGQNLGVRAAQVAVEGWCSWAAAALAASGTLRMGWFDGLLNVPSREFMRASLWFAPWASIYQGRSMMLRMLSTALVIPCPGSGLRRRP